MVKTDLDDLNSKTLQIGSFSATTNARGYFQTSLSVSNIIVLSAWDNSTDQSCIIIPFVGNKITWYFKVLGNANMGSIENTTITVKYIYSPIV